MKKIIVKLPFLVFIAILCSCSFDLYQTVSEQANLATYNNANFLITTGDIKGDYTPIQYVESETRSGYIPKDQKAQLRENVIADDLYFANNKNSSPKASRVSSYKYATPSAAISTIYMLSKLAGANAIINLKIEKSTYRSPFTHKNHITYKASGLAVKK